MDPDFPDLRGRVSGVPYWDGPTPTPPPSRDPVREDRSGVGRDEGSVEFPCVVRTKSVPLPPSVLETHSPNYSPSPWVGNGRRARGEFPSGLHPRRSQRFPRSLRILGVERGGGRSGEYTTR